MTSRGEDLKGSANNGKNAQELGAALVSAAALPGPHRMWQRRRKAAAVAEAIDTSTVRRVSYWLWDANQLPAYQACADKFTAATPMSPSRSPSTDGTTTGPSSPTASSLVMHPTSSPTTWPSTRSSSAKQQLVALDETLAKDGFNVDQYQEGLADLWKGQDGKRYGLPKDFDTVAIFYNKKLVADGGVKEADLQNLQWNPTDGGTYEKMIAHLTVDESGSAETSPALTSPRSRSTAWDSTAVRAAETDRPSGACTPAPTTGPHRQEPVGHPLQLRPARLPADHCLVPLTDRQGLHAIR